MPACEAIYMTFLRRPNSRSRKPTAVRVWELWGRGLSYRGVREFWGAMAIFYIWIVVAVK